MRNHFRTSHITEGLRRRRRLAKGHKINGLRERGGRKRSPKMWEAGVATSHLLPIFAQRELPIGGLTWRLCQMAGSKLESKFLFLWRVAQGPQLEREFRFHATRKWRADFAHMGSRTLIEIEGGIFQRGAGRHNRGAGYAKDAEKYLEAVLAGWTVLRLTEKQLELDFIERIVALINTPRGGAHTLSCDQLR